MSLVLALLGLLFLIRSGRAETAPEMALMILVGPGLWVWAVLNLLPKIY
jgi:hypothetical protein